MGSNPTASANFRFFLILLGPVGAKAGKSAVIFWFPIPKCFGDAVIEWIDALLGLGFTGDDALFPESSSLKHSPAFPSQVGARHVNDTRCDGGVRRQTPLP